MWNKAKDTTVLLADESDWKLMLEMQIKWLEVGQSLKMQGMKAEQYKNKSKCRTREEKNKKKKAICE